MTQTAIAPFKEKLAHPLTKNKITVLQVNLGKRCNLACSHCHVEAGPKRTEELSPEICQQLIEVIHRFPQIQTVDLTGGAPEMNYGFRPLVEAARSEDKEVIVRSNLTIFFEPGFTDLPEYFAKNRLRVVASLPCYLEDNVDRMRGSGVYQASIQALQKLNQLGYGHQPELILDLVFNPQVPQSDRFSLTPQQQKLEQDYKQFLRENFAIEFNQLFTITNLPIGRTKFQLKKQKIHNAYLGFLESNFNPTTVDYLMCRNELSVDYLGNIFDCDFNQMENLPARMPNGEALTVAKLLELNNLDVLAEVQTAPYCYGCTAGCGSSCGGALI
ncbi:arsenosugar biosynthesis radical SAM protein ArsS [Desertifilum sp. FACHB-1129]|uniref:Radical SAM protein n=1 Tax=Desertifilum tharense IPPAS B-1220 TaxID=1781255 RepID=A0A1E5QCJ7_9CYAN|nr:MULTISPECIES: arsenosugar biosynthesis radical SAM (seleno)protein ArsS [Desertifilum]MDA0210888.1 arsenosugar biosynthesis radical SAM protein ArsS [Cyanobacteria bacterium FC1]MBD2312121.1 arsenosugar biosynthesis radical SAM protein ArsS [Desertifilum sp. FACHB-1129]MBD2322218.1 arsenosugar biosynthesis radical SAM protein ArsS [Desertifilum sp. FACHB-866]MBD2332255.1 arsenosugar biosynthesis radical SAM protein ArsS [Desertifilum sp. FACHB-868]OEJ72388.1 radical SAM protein [Desertifilu